MSLDRLRLISLIAAALGSSADSGAQSAAPAASGASAELTPAERAKRDGDKVFHWILIHGDKPRKAAASRDDKPPTRAKLPARTAARSEEPVPVAAAAPAVIEAVASPAPAASAAAPAAELPAPAPEPAVATVAAPSAEEPATEPLTPLAQPEPRFPANLLRTLRSGQVQVRFTVLPDGSVAEPVVVASSNSRLNPSALAAVAQWRFAPVHKPQQGIVDLGFNNAE